MSRNIQIREPGNNYADVLHPETNSGMVLMEDGRTLADYMAQTDEAFTSLCPFIDNIDKTTAGIFINRWNGSGAGTPPAANVYGWVLTFNTSASYGSQLFVANDVNATTYRRNLREGVFQPWVKILTTLHKAESATTLWSADWTGTTAPFTQVKTISGILATDTPIVDVIMSGTYSTDAARAEAWGYIYRAVTGANSITFYANEKPTVSLPIQIKVVR